MSKNLIRKNQSKRYPTLSVLKYDKSVFYKNLWKTNDELLECRGHVVDENGKIVIRPFTKIFNFGENGTTIHRDTDVLYINKINGFMASATYVPSVGEVVISTTGSLDSEFVHYAENYLLGDVTAFIKNRWEKSGIARTYLFEIVHPDDPHIIKERYGAYLIGMRDVEDFTAYFSNIDKEICLDETACIMGVMRPKWGTCKFGDLVKESKTAQHEGFVVYEYGTSTKVALKIKTPYYLVLKMFARKKVIQLLDKTKVDEEYFGLISHIEENKDIFNSLSEQERLNFMRDYFYNDNFLHAT